MRLVRSCLIVCLFLLHTQLLQANDTAEPEIRLLVLGDSLTAGYGLSAEKSFPAQLQSALRAANYNVEVINAGVSGDTSAGGLSRLLWALSDNPRIVIVELGANDALRGLPPEQTYDNLDSIIDQLIKKQILVILAGMRSPRNMGKNYSDAFDLIYPRLAEKHHIPLYPFFLDGVALNPDLNQPDGIHPNAAGVSVVVDRMLPYVRSAINSLQCLPLM